MNAINNDAAKPSDLPEKILHYINGEFVESIDGEEFDVVDPVTNQTYITAASGKPQDIDRAVAAAKEAFEQHCRRRRNACGKTCCLGIF